MDTSIVVTIVDADPVQDPAFQHTLLIVRSDSHVAWRSNSLPREIGSLVSRLRGATVA